jgi:uncharacterized protein YaiE (UPF0345 family)
MDPQQQQQNDSKADEIGKQGILSLNELRYQFEPDMSVCTARSVSSQFFQSQTYAPGSTGICIVNSGSSFVNAAQSSITIDVKNTSSVAVYFGSSAYGCSAANLINRLSILSRSGSVIERIDKANALACITVMYKKSKTWQEFGSGSHGHVLNPSRVGLVVKRDTTFRHSFKRYLNFFWLGLNTSPVAAYERYETRDGL